MLIDSGLKDDDDEGKLSSRYLDCLALVKLGWVGDYSCIPKYFEYPLKKLDKLGIEPRTFRK